MARMRTVKPGFFTNEILCSLPPLTRLLFEGLWCQADREGRLEDRPRRLKMEILPYDDCDVDEMLQVLADTHDHDGAPFILRYDVKGVRYIQIAKFGKHQTPHCKESASSIPAPGLHSADTVPAPLGCGNMGSGEWVMGSGGAPARVPSIEQVTEYATAIGHPSEARKYFDARQAVGWHKNRQPILDWQADFRGWTTNGFQHSTAITPSGMTKEEKKKAQLEEWAREAQERKSCRSTSPVSS